MTDSHNIPGQLRHELGRSNAIIIMLINCINNYTLRQLNDTRQTFRWGSMQFWLMLGSDEQNLLDPIGFGGCSSYGALDMQRISKDSAYCRLED